MFCSKCGNRIPDNESFCTACGTPCTKVNAETANTPVADDAAVAASVTAAAVVSVAPGYTAETLTPVKPVRPPFVSVIVELCLLLATFLMMFTLTFTDSYKHFLSGDENVGMFGQTAGDFDNMGPRSVFMTFFIVMFIVTVILGVMPFVTRKWKSGFLVPASITSIALLSWFFLAMLIETDRFDTVCVSLAGWIFLVLDILTLVMSFVTISKMSSYAQKKIAYERYI